MPVGDSAGEICPSCGRSVPSTSLFLDPLPPTSLLHDPRPPTGAPAAAGDGATVSPGAPPVPDPPPPPPPARRNRRLTALAVAAVLVAGGTIATLAGDGDDPAETATGTTSVSRRAPRTTVLRRPVAPQVSPTTAVTLAPLPAGTPAGTLLLGTASGRVFRIDLASGDVDQIEDASRDLREAWNVRLVAGHLVAALPRGVVALSPGDLGVRTDLGVASSFFATDERLWLVEFAEGPPIAREVRFEDGGIDLGRPYALPAGSDVRTATDSGLVIQLGGQAFLHDPADGEGTPLPSGSIVAATGDRLARVACDRSLTCRLEISDLRGGGAVTVDPPEGLSIDPWLTGSFSRSGGRLWVGVAGTEHSPGLVVVDVASGAMTPVEAPGGWQGSASWLGEWLVVPTSEGLMLAGPGGEALAVGGYAFGTVQWVAALGQEA